MKIAIYAICKNEQHNVEAWLENVKDADTVVVVDTGSTDDTFKAFQTNTVGFVELHTAEFKPFRFDVARNFSLAQVPRDIDYCLFLDLDERLSDGWYEVLKAELEAHAPDEVTMDLISSVDANGDVKTTFYQTKCHKRNDYTWRYPCHEVLISNLGTDTSSLVSAINVTHLPDDTDVDYLDLLAIGAKERPDDQRALYYYGRELYSNGDYTRAIEILTLGVDAKYMQWSKQKAACYKFLAYSINELNGLRAAEYYFLQYLSLSLDEAEAYYAVAEVYYENEEHYMAKGLLERLLKLAENSSKTDNFIYRDIECWTWKPHDLLAYVNYYIGNYPAYLVSAIKAHELCPSDEERLRNNVLDAYRHNPNIKEASDG